MCPFYFVRFPTLLRIKDTTYPAITKASEIPTKLKSGHRLAPVSTTPVVTDANRSCGVVVPKKSIFHLTIANKKPFYQPPLTI